MRWIELTELSQITSIDAGSHERAVLIFKHSTRCILSNMILNRLQRAWPEITEADHPLFLLDLIRYRTVSNALTAHYGIEHASPQVLVIRNGQCVHHASHMAITYEEVMEILAGREAK